MLWLSRKLSPQHWILRRHTNWTSVQVTLAHHCTSHDNQWGRAEAEFIGSQESSHNHIKTSAQLAVRLQHDPKRMNAMSGCNFASDHRIPAGTRKGFSLVVIILIYSPGASESSHWGLAGQKSRQS